MQESDDFKLRFISSMPRSGSTLLCNILAQNPKFFSTPTSGLCDMLMNIKHSWDALVEHKAAPDDKAKIRVLRSTIRSYHGQDKIVFDKSRGWLPHIEMMEMLLGEKNKVICTLRPIPEVLASFEKLYRKTAMLRKVDGEQENYFKFQTIEGRCDYWLRDDQMVGLMLNRIRDAIDRELSDRILFIEYNDLVSRPKEIFELIYEFLDEDLFPHDFNNVKQVTVENDEVHGFVGLHDIRPVVEYVASDALRVLGKRLFEKYDISIF